MGAAVVMLALEPLLRLLFFHRLAPFFISETYSRELVPEFSWTLIFAPAFPPYSAV
jgi:hypothetical protein